MKYAACLCLLVLLSSCASREIVFEPEKTCSQPTLNFLKRNKARPFLQSQEVIDAMQGTQSGVQACYESYAKRSGKEEFDTCLVVSYNRQGKLDFWELSSQHVKLDQEFINCANKVIGAVPFWKFGKNYTLMQSYHFYKE